MPVTTRVAPVEVKRASANAQWDSASLLRAVSPSLWKADNQVLASSFGKSTDIRPDRNGFVCTVVDAYLQHNHLVLRPDDLWFAILVQFSFYVNKHSEEMRKYFVEHAGKKKLQVLQEQFDFEVFCLHMTNLIADNVKDPALREWIMPSFSTTTSQDRITAAIIMMGTMQKYFAYFCGITCGIPSVTLLGERADWEDILERISYISTFGPEHEELMIWNSVLKAVVSKFVETFDAPDSPGVVSFWQRTVHQYADNYSGEKLITGWIQAFCFWTEHGQPLAVSSVLRMTQDWRNSVKEEGLDFWLDGIRLGELSWDSIPAAYAHVPIHLKMATNKKFMTRAIAGSVGWKVVDSEAIFKHTRGVNRSKHNLVTTKKKALWLVDTSAKHTIRAQPQPSVLTESTLVEASPATTTAHAAHVSSSTQKPSFFRFIAQMLCLSDVESDSATLTDVGSAKRTSNTTPKLNLNMGHPSPDSLVAGVFRKPFQKQESAPADPKSEEIKKNDQYQGNYSTYMLKNVSENAPQISDLSELNEPWEYEAGGSSDTLQPVTGWWLMKTSDGQYGKDPDCPDVQFDSDADDYDEDLARNARPLEA